MAKWQTGGQLGAHQQNNLEYDDIFEKLEEARDSKRVRLLNSTDLTAEIISLIIAGSPPPSFHHREPITSLVSPIANECSDTMATTMTAIFFCLLR